jgi:hypothetical protein
MLYVVTLKTAIETKAALQLGQQWLGTFLTDLQHISKVLLFSRYQKSLPESDVQSVC